MYNVQEGFDKCYGNTYFLTVIYENTRLHSYFIGSNHIRKNTAAIEMICPQKKCSLSGNEKQYLDGV